MTYRIILKRQWRYRHPTRGMQEFEPGAYRVPDDVDDRLAQRALAEGMATRAGMNADDAARVMAGIASADRKVAGWDYAATRAADPIAETFAFDFAKIFDGRERRHTITLPSAKLAGPTAALRKAVELDLTEASVGFIQQSEQRVPSPRRGKAPARTTKMLPGAPENKQALA
jgi:hypothetical protein